MKSIKLILLLSFFINMNGFSQTKTIHVFVALCNDNTQFVTPISPNYTISSMPETNIFWGLENGVLNYFKNKTDNWELVKLDTIKNNIILQSALFKHKTKDVFILAEAYSGKHTNNVIKEYLDATSGQKTKYIKYKNQTLEFGGKSTLTSYLGLNGLMNESINLEDHKNVNTKETIVLCSYSKIFFERNLEYMNAYPILWTQQLMNPEAYILETAINSWLENDEENVLLNKVAKNYNLYQRCGVSSALKVFKSGF